jgi:hypothetical protein
MDVLAVLQQPWAQSPVFAYRLDVVDNFTFTHDLTRRGRRGQRGA